MGKMNDIYNAYLQEWHTKHTNVVQPTTSDSQPDITGAVLVSGTCKYWQSFGRVYKLTDGKVCEVSNRCSATWNSESDWINYEQPQSFTAFFGQW